MSDSELRAVGPHIPESVYGSQFNPTGQIINSEMPGTKCLGNVVRVVSCSNPKIKLKYQ